MISSRTHADEITDGKLQHQLINKIRRWFACGDPHQTAVFGRPLHSSKSDTSFPIIAVAVIGILSTAFLLVSYYIFVIKCCLNWHRIDLLRRYSLSRRSRDPPLMDHSPGLDETSGGLDESVIRLIPVVHYKKLESGFCECSVCLNEFQEDEKLRVIPICSHVFHIDCIDVWLQSNANCPLCRIMVSATTPLINSDTHDQSFSPTSSPQNLVLDRDESFATIELSIMSSTDHDHSDHSGDQLMLAARRQERSNSGELSIRISPLKKGNVGKKSRRHKKVTSMGDEVIDTIREKDEQFVVQPIRRSISMDSSTDRQFYLAIQEALRHHDGLISEEEISPNIEGGTSTSTSSSSRLGRSCFSFGVHGRGSRRGILPVYLDP